MNPLTPEIDLILDRMVGDQNFRLAMVRKSFFWFFHFYFQTYAKYPTADFQREIFQVLENQEYQNIVITAFRGSSKSTLVTLAYVIWSILGEQNKKFPLILGDTQTKAQTHLLAIKHEFEQNLARTPKFAHNPCMINRTNIQEYEKASHRSGRERADYQPH